MNMNPDPRSNVKNEQNDGRKSYKAPAIIYEGKITVRAGTGDAFPFQDGPGLPFDDPTSSK